MSVRARLGLACLAVAVAVAATAVTAFAAGGNSANAAVCRDWQTLYRTDGTAFKNRGDCASYAAQGGVPKAASLEWTVGDCPFVGEPIFCLFLSGFGLAPGASGTAFDVVNAGVHGVAVFPVPVVDANGVIASTPVVVAGRCGGTVYASITYPSATGTPITADYLFDAPPCVG